MVPPGPSALLTPGDPMPRALTSQVLSWANVRGQAGASPWPPSQLEDTIPTGSQVPGTLRRKGEVLFHQQWDLHGENHMQQDNIC